MVMGRAESCGILSLPEWPDPTGTKRRVCVPLGTPQWLWALFSIYSRVCKRARTPGEAGDIHEEGTKKGALAKRDSCYKPQPAGATRECGPCGA